MNQIGTSSELNEMMNIDLPEEREMTMINETQQSSEEQDANVERTVLPRTYAYGHDFGNAEIGGVLLKVTASGDAKNPQVISRSIPTAFSRVNTTHMKNMGVDMSNALVIQMKGSQLSYGIGSIAMEQSVDSWNGRGDLDRYASSYSLMGLLAVSASMIPDPEYGLMVVTGLPAETYIKNAGLRKEIKKALTGTHTFTIDGGRHWRTCHVELGPVVMEGAGALVAYGGKDGGAVGSAIIDIGGRTTDLYVARKQVPLTDFCTGRPLGVQTATQIVMDSFEAEHDQPLSQLEARDIMHAWVASQQAMKAAEEAVAREANAAGVVDAGKPAARKRKGATAKQSTEYPPISIKGVRVDNKDIERYVNEAIADTAYKIVSFVAQSWRQSDSSNAVAARFNPVLCIGGGAYYFFEALQQRIPHLRMPSDPVYANARGYATTAAKALERKQQAKA
jgi:hypothetical protein